MKEQYMKAVEKIRGEFKTLIKMLYINHQIIFTLYFSLKTGFMFLNVSNVK